MALYQVVHWCSDAIFSTVLGQLWLVFGSVFFVIFVLIMVGF